MTESSMLVYVLDVSCFPPFGVAETTLKRAIHISGLSLNLFLGSLVVVAAST